jgi:KaiC/GvpD/RAD55 family RecA-like ATPase
VEGILPGKATTGINGLDQLLEGGIPQGRTLLVVGGPGAGKTILASQFIFNGIQQQAENGVFVSLDEGEDHFFREMQHFGWDFKKAEQEKKFVFIDATRMSRVALLKEKLYGDEAKSLRGKQLSIDKLIEELQAKIKSVNAKRVAVDTLAALLYRFPDPADRRTAIIDMIESLSDLGTTTIVTTELDRLSLERSALIEEYLAHGVIVMQTLFSQGATTRAIQVEKMRGAKVNPSLVPYIIDKNGIEVFPDMTLFEAK